MGQLVQSVLLERGLDDAVSSFAKDHRLAGPFSLVRVLLWSSDCGLCLVQIATADCHVVLCCLKARRLRRERHDTVKLCKDYVHALTPTKSYSRSGIELGWLGRNWYRRACGFTAKVEYVEALLVHNLELVLLSEQDLVPSCSFVRRVHLIWRISLLS